MDRFISYPRRLTSLIDKSIESLTILSIVIINLQLIGCSLVTPLTGYHHHHHHQGFPPQDRWTKPPIHRSHHGRPVDIMTDVINDLGVRILDRYVDNAGNVGFSPSGLGFVLVALYEGSAGNSNHQIGDVLGLPNDRRITRIGLRDIHRRLRSYLNADAFLGGLTLNRDDINLRPEYEDILRFYGFDISDSGIDGNATTLPGMATDGFTGSMDQTDGTSPAANTLVASTDPSTSQSTATATSESTTSATNPPTITATNPPTTIVTNAMPTTINDAVEIITDMTDGTNSALSMASTAAPTTLNAMSQIAAANNSTSTDATNGITDSLPSTTLSIMSPLTTGILTTLTSTTPVISSTIPASDNRIDTMNTTVPMQRLVGPPTDSADMQTQGTTRIVTMTTVENSTTSIASMISPTDRGNASSTDLPTSTVMIQRIIASSMFPTEMGTQSSGSFSATNPPSTGSNNPQDSTTIVPSQRLVASSANTPQMENEASTILAMTTIPSEDTSTEPAEINISATLPMSTSETSSTNAQIDTSMKNANEDVSTNSVRKRRGIPHGAAGYFSSTAEDGIWLDEFGRLNAQDDYPSQDEDIVADSKRPTEVAFLVNGCDYSRVTAAAYTAVLPFAYFPSFRASLLEFPLDDPRYKILVMLPSESNGTRRLARLLATEGITLRQLRRSLRPNWITAVIPSFMLRGFVTLTPFLQRIGISDVFEPRAADLSPMSPDLGVYARDIQQSIGVNIRNNARGGIGGADGGNQDQQRSRSAALIRNARGVVALPPFFVADRAISPQTRGDSHYSPYPRAGNILYEKAHPLPFVVDRPFLYFIIDDETSVTLLAGRIDDPLNSRML